MTKHAHGENWFESFRRRDQSTLADITTSLAPLSMWALDRSTDLSEAKADVNEPPENPET